MSVVMCPRCGGNVYEYGPPNHGLGRVVSQVTGCTPFSCYGCGRRGWLRKGRSHLGIAILARMIQGVVILFIAIAIAITLFGVLTH